MHYSDQIEDGCMSQDSAVTFHVQRTKWLQYHLRQTFRIVMSKNYYNLFTFDRDIKDVKQQHTQPPFCSHYTGQPAIAGTSS